MVLRNENTKGMIALMLIFTIMVFSFQYFSGMTGRATGTVSAVVLPNNLTFDRTAFDDSSTSVLTNLTEFDNLTGFKIGKASAGLIEFTESLDLSGGGINFTSAVNINFAKITVDSVAAPALNKGATITMRNLPFITPVIFRDNVACPASICTQQNYSSGTLVFNVTHFTTYEAREEQAAAAPTPAFLFEGGHEAEKGEAPAKPPQAEEKAAVFDLAVQVVPPFEYVVPGEYLLIVTQIVNFGTPGIKTVSLTYSIINGKEETVVLQEQLPVETSGEVARRIAIPYNMPFGKYKLKVVAEYGNFITTSYAQFNVVPKVGGATARFFLYGGQNALAVSIIVLATAFAAMTVYLFAHLRKHKQTEEKIVNYVRSYVNYLSRGKSK